MGKYKQKIIVVKIMLKASKWNLNEKEMSKTTQDHVIVNI